MTGVLGLVVAWLVWRDARRKDTTAAAEEHIKRLIETALQPVRDRQRDLVSRLETLTRQQGEQQRQQQEMVDRLGRTLDRMAVMQTKIDVYWKTVENLAMDAAKIIHSPDPRRRHIDELLEAYREHCITPAQRTELRKLLEQIVDWEPGQDLGFPIHAGEQFAAAFVLSTMDLVAAMREVGEQ